MLRVVVGSGRGASGKQDRRLPGSQAHAFSLRFERHIKASNPRKVGNNSRNTDRIVDAKQTLLQ